MTQYTIVTLIALSISPIAGAWPDFLKWPKKPRCAPTAFVISNAEKSTSQREDFDAIEPWPGLLNDARGYINIEYGGEDGVIDKLQKLGWDYEDVYRDPRRAIRIIKEGISAPLSNWIYYGTSSAHLPEIFEKGLSQPQHCVTHYPVAKLFGSGDAHWDGGTFVILRWRSSRPRPKILFPQGTVITPQQHTVTVQVAYVAPSQIEFSEDGGKTWKAREESLLNNNR